MKLSRSQHRIWQGFLNLRGPVTLGDVKFCMWGERKPVSDYAARVQLSKMRRKMPAVQIKAEGGGYVVDLDPHRMRCKFCPHTVMEPTRRPKGWVPMCDGCRRAWMAGFGEAARRAARPARVRRAISMVQDWGGGLAGGEVSGGEGSQGFHGPAKGQGEQAKMAGGTGLPDGA